VCSAVCIAVRVAVWVAVCAAVCVAVRSCSATVLDVQPPATPPSFRQVLHCVGVALYVAMCAAKCVAVCCSAMHCVLQCVAVCCSLLQRIMKLCKTNISSANGQEPYTIWALLQQILTQLGLFFQNRALLQQHFNK